MEKKLINIHIPKTAGLSLHKIMIEQFGKEKVYKLGVYEKDQTTEKLLSRTVNDFDNMSKEELDNYNYFSGHFPNGIQNKFNEDDIDLITCLRDPVDRVISLFMYLQREKQIEDDFFSWIENSYEAQNGMVKRFCGFYKLHKDNDKDTYNYILDNKKTNHYEIDEDDLITAISNLSQVSLVMFTEYFTESLVLLENLIDRKPLFSIEAQFTNSTVGSWKNSLSNEEVEHITSIVTQYNKYDILLYQYFRSRFENILKTQSAGFFERVTALKTLSGILVPEVGTYSLDKNMFLSRLNNLITNMQTLGKYKELYDIFCLLVEKFPKESEFIRIKNSLAEKI